MKIAIFTDLHLGLRNDSQAWNDFIFKWFDSMIEHLEQNHINTIFFLGDWFHNRAAISSISINNSVKILEKLKNYDLWIFPGNHDLYYNADTITEAVSSVSMTMGYPNVHYISRPTKVILDNKSIMLCPWGFNPLDDSMETTDYLFGHFEINTFQMSSAGSLCENGLALTDLFKKYNRIFSGHFHKEQKRAYSSGYIQYVGNPFQMNFGESNDNKGFMVLDLKTDEYYQVKNEISPKFVKVKASKLAKSKPDKLEKLIKNNFVRIIIDNDDITDDAVNELVKLVIAAKPFEYDIDWDNAGISSKLASKSDFQALELEDALTEFVNLLDVAEPKKLLEYLNNKRKEVELTLN